MCSCYLGTYDNFTELKAFLLLLKYLCRLVILGAGSKIHGESFNVGRDILWTHHTFISCILLLHISHLLLLLYF
jgi:hypothetical protein